MVSGGFYFILNFLEGGKGVESLRGHMSEFMFLKIPVLQGIHLCNKPAID